MTLQEKISPQADESAATQEQNIEENLFSALDSKEVEELFPQLVAITLTPNPISGL